MKKISKQRGSLVPVQLDQLASVGGGEGWFTVLKSTADAKSEVQKELARFN